MSIRRLLMAQKKSLESFVDSNGFHLLAPSWMNEGDEMEWCQLISISSTPSTIENGVTYTNLIDGRWRINGTATGTAFPSISISNIKIEIGQLYTLGGMKGNTKSEKTRIWFENSAFHVGNRLLDNTICAASTDSIINSYKLYVYNGNTADNLLWSPMLFNLTKMCGDNVNTSMTTSAVFKQFGYEDNNSMPYFDPSKNGTLIAHNGKLYRKKV